MIKTNPVTHRIPHDLSLEAAGRAGRKAINSYTKQYEQIAGRWETPYLFRLKANVAFVNITGKVEIDEHAITFSIDHVPAIFSGFIDRAVIGIDQAVKSCIAKAKKDQ